MVWGLARNDGVYTQNTAMMFMLERVYYMDWRFPALCLTVAANDVSAIAMATLASWDEVAPPSFPAAGRDDGGADGDSSAKARRRRPAAQSQFKPRGAVPAAASHQKQGDRARGPPGLGLVPQRPAPTGLPAEAAALGGASAAARLGGGGAESSPEKKRAYNPGRYVRVSKESNFDADLFANRATKRDDLPVVLSKKKLLGNEILAPQLAKVSPRVRIPAAGGALAGRTKGGARHSHPDVAEKMHAVASRVYGSLEDSVDAVVLRQLGLDARGNPTRSTQQPQLKKGESCALGPASGATR